MFFVKCQPIQISRDARRQFSYGIHGSFWKQNSLSSINRSWRYSQFDKFDLEMYGSHSGANNLVKPENVLFTYSLLAYKKTYLLLCASSDWQIRVWYRPQNPRVLAANHEKASTRNLWSLSLELAPMFQVSPKFLGIQPPNLRKIDKFRFSYKYVPEFHQN